MMMEPEEWLDKEPEGAHRPATPEGDVPALPDTEEEEETEEDEEQEEDEPEEAKKAVEEFKKESGSLTEEELDKHDEPARQRLKEHPVLYSPHDDPRAGTPEAEAAVRDAIQGKD
jgi:hypothetical protein